MLESARGETADLETDRGDQRLQTLQAVPSSAAPGEELRVRAPSLGTGIPLAPGTETRGSKSRRATEVGCPGLALRQIGVCPAVELAAGATERQVPRAGGV